MDAAISQLNQALIPLVHAERYREAAQIVSDVCQLKLKISSEDPEVTLPPLQHWLHFLLNEPGGMIHAAQLLWTPNKFDPRPQYTQDLWKFFDETNQGLIMGSASTSKSYSLGVRQLLEWTRDPEWTTINLVGPNEDHLEKNLFTHLVALHQSAKLPLPGQVFRLWIGLDRRNQIGAIHGVVIPLGRTRKAGKLQGTKRVRRNTPHNIFGDSSRLFIVVDEIENVPNGLWKDIDNVLSNTETNTVNSGFKVFGAYNPTNREDEVAKRAEPMKGWGAFNIDEDYRWKSKRGWDVLRLDGEKCENVVQGRKVFSGLQTREGLEAIARNSGGKQSAGYHSMGRGAYPPQGTELTIFPPGLVDRIRGEYIWYDPPKAVVGVDLALEGGDVCLFALGEYGLASGVKYAPTTLYPHGRKVMYRDASGAVTPRHGVQLKQLFTIERGDTLATAERVIEMCRKVGVRPEMTAVDATSWGAGVASLMKRLWAPNIVSISYSEGSSEEKLFEEDEKLCSELYERIYSELWFALRGWAEFGYFLIHPQVDTSKLAPQLTQRLQITGGVRSKIESKKDYKDRGPFDSPNEADATTLIIMAMRRAGIKVSMRGASTESGEGDDYNDLWLPGNDSVVIIDSTNRFDTLDL